MLDRADWLAICLPFLVQLGLLLILQHDSLDERLSDLFFDTTSGTWPHVEGYWPKWILHKRAKQLVFTLAASALLVGITGQLKPSLRHLRDPALFLALSVGVTVGVVALLKHYSPIPCPWQSTRYGGSIPHLPFPSSYPEGLPLGKCFPGAHASGAFAFMSLYFSLRAFSRRLAWFGLAFGWTLGMIFGAAQVTRGAHYASHNMWAAIIAWAIICALYFAFYRRRLAQLEAASAPENAQ
jgi:membrane-associated PAP2 superfamily phosphatase